MRRSRRLRDRIAYNLAIQIALVPDLTWLPAPEQWIVWRLAGQFPDCIHPTRLRKLAADTIAEVPIAAEKQPTNPPRSASIRRPDLPGTRQSWTTAYSARAGGSVRQAFGRTPEGSTRAH